MDGAYGLRFVYNTNRPETHAVYRDWRKIAESYSPARLLLGETWVPDAERLAAYYGDHDELQLGFNFPFAFASFDPGRLARIVERTLAALPPGACPVWMGSNHDLGRFPSRWCGGDERKTRLALLVLATLPGTSVLYYGDEIGMTDVDVPVALRRDNATLDVAQGADRDRARTPMPWDGSPGGGFTGRGVTPWLPLGDPPLGSVADQRDDAGSVLSLCRDLLALRRARARRRPGGVREPARGRRPVGRTGPVPWWWPRTSPISRPAARRARSCCDPARPRARRLASCARGKGSSRAQRDERPGSRIGISSAVTSAVRVVAARYLRSLTGP